MNLYENQPDKGYIDLGKDVLHISTSKKQYEIAVIEVSRMEFVYNKSILWLVIGGLSASLAGVGFIKSIISPWAALAYIIFGVLLFYYGWQGRSMLQIQYGLHGKLVLSVDDNERRWSNFIAAFREIRALH